MYVPTLLAVSPLAATRSAPTRTTSTSPRAIRCPAATSGSSVCGTPAWASSQVVSRAPWRYGRVSSTQTWIGAPGMVRRLDDAERGPELAAGQRPGVAVGQDRGPADPPVPGRIVQAELGEPAVVGRRLEDDRVGLGAHRVGDRVAVLGQLAELVVAGHHPLDRPAQVDRRRAALMSALAEPRIVALRAYGRPSRWFSALRASPMAATWPMRRRAADDHLADRVGHLAGRPARVLDEGVRQAALVDEVQDAAVLAERRPEAGRRRADRSAPRRAGASAATEPSGFEDRAGRLGRGPLQRLRRAGHRRRGLDQLAGECPEEPPPTEVHRPARWTGAVAAADVGRRPPDGAGAGVGRLRVGAGVARLVGQSCGLDAGWPVST